MYPKHLTSALGAMALAAMLLVGAPGASAHSRLSANGKEIAPKHVTHKTQAPNLLHTLKGRSGNGSVTCSADIQRHTVTKRIEQKPQNRLTTASPRGHLFGSVGSYTGMTYYNDAFWGEINTSNGNVTPIWKNSIFGNGQDYDIMSGAVRDGVFYTPTVKESLYDDPSIKWERYDLATGKKLSSIDFKNIWSAYLYTMTYDAANDKFYGFGLDYATQSYGNFMCVDGKTGAFEEFGHLTNIGFIGAIAWNPADGKLYCIDDANDLFEIDLELGKLVELGHLEDDYQLVTYGYTSTLVYSPLDGCFVMAYPDPIAKAMVLLYIDPEQLTVTPGVTLDKSTNPYFTSLYCPDSYAVNDAPAEPAAPVFSFDKASLSGKMTFTAPSVTYADIAITTPVDVKVTFDGNVPFSGAMNPGESKTLDINSTEGLHNVTVEASIGENKSPVCSTKVAIGNDVPCAPANLKYNDGKLTWTAPGSVGANKGYVDTAALTYDVFVNGEKENAQPLTACEYTLNANRTLADYTIGVKASANNQVSAATTVNAIYGDALTIPYACDLKTGYELFQTWAPAKSQDTFVRQFDEDEGYYAFRFYPDSRNIDHWLFMPKMAFTDTEHKYQLQFTMRNALPYEGSFDMEVMLCSEADPKSVVGNIFTYEGANLMRQSRQKLEFAVPVAGDYYIGFHVTREEEGVQLAKFNVNALSTSSAVPADPTVKITPAPLGAHSATVEVTAPTLDLTGKTLDANDALTVTVMCEDEQEKIQLLPGTSGNLQIAVPLNGYNKFKVTPSNANGAGVTRTYSVYVGFDNPMCPSNIKVVPTQDNMGAVVTWDAPGSVGYHGGYVDPSKVTYTFYTVEGITYNAIASNIADTRYAFTPNLGWERQHRYVMGPVAVNEAGESRNSIFVQEILGTPYPMPVHEDCMGGGFMYPEIYFDCPELAASVTMAGSIKPYNTGCKTDFEGEGLLVFSTTSGPTYCDLVLSKMSTKNAECPTFKLRWLDWEYTPEYSVYGRSNKNPDYQLLEDFKAEYPKTGTWRDSAVHLPSWMEDCDWVQFRIKIHLSSKFEEYGFIDSYSLVQQIDNDMMISEIAGPKEVTVGESYSYNVVVANSGLEPVSGTLNVKVTNPSGESLYESSDKIRRLGVNDNFVKVVPIQFTADHLKEGKVVISATIDSDEDMVAYNNAMTTEIKVKNPQAPIVTDLQGKRVDNGVELAWTEPDLEYGGNDGFDNQLPFLRTENLGMWKNYDLDQKQPFRITGLEWPENQEAVGWHVINARKLGVMEDERLAPHSGEQYIMARSISYDEDTEDPIQSNDWLVSPEIVPGTPISFWYNTIDPSLTEYVDLYVSYTGDNVDPDNCEYRASGVEGAPDQLMKCGDFEFVRSFSKDGAEAWEYVYYELPAGAKYFALVYHSIDSFAAMLDDIEFTPKHMMQWELNGYQLVRTLDEDGFAETLHRTEGTSTSDTEVGGDGATYNVACLMKVEGGEVRGPLSNAVRVLPTSVVTVEALEGVYGVKGALVAEGFAGRKLYIYDASGRYVAELDVKAEKVILPVAAGIYMVSSDNKSAAKVLVK